MIRRALLLLLLAAPVAAQDVLVERNPGGQPFFAPDTGPWTANDLICAGGPNQLLIGGSCNSLGGGPGGSDFTDCIDDTLNTANGQPHVETTDTFPPGAEISECLVTITATVSGGVYVGIDGAPRMWGASGGTVSDTNRLSPHMVGSTRAVAAEAVRLTSAHSSGNFQNDTGEIHVVCRCRETTAP